MFVSVTWRVTICLGWMLLPQSIAVGAAVSVFVLVWIAPLEEIFSVIAAYMIPVRKANKKTMRMKMYVFNRVVIKHQLVRWRRSLWCC